MRRTANRKPDAARQKLLDEFAKAAPSEIPEWFEHRPAPNKPDSPDVADFPEIKEWHDIARRWLRKPETSNRAMVEEFPEFRRFVEAAADFHEAFAVWRSADQVSRFIQWRWHFAALMVQAREQGGLI